MGVVPSEQVDSAPPSSHLPEQSMNSRPPAAQTSSQLPIDSPRCSMAPANIAGITAAPAPPPPAASLSEMSTTYTENPYSTYPRDPDPLSIGAAQQLTFDQMININYAQAQMAPNTCVQPPPPSGYLAQPTQSLSSFFVPPAPAIPYQQRSRAVVYNPVMQTLNGPQLRGYPNVPQLPFNGG
ncbi:uncharacterized protein EI90DRAFT_2124299 [Cantharellus anzutake]|uniref:uncharacterized protein n=1 Tax=Cantharellus anzutake TaxID=1750568 RepID=UPI001908E8C1|nr:uncharacterized protein EI90DRAFT_2124299 [Cantharellus anzutake]KAF8325579.1 hypothetical protein EI90DRAFT_2124299 [Cantharellus anzutake]